MQIGGKPVIKHFIRRLTSQGVRETAINVHYHADQIMPNPPHNASGDFNG